MMQSMDRRELDYLTLWVPKTLSTAEKRGFGLKKEGFSNRGTRTEWPLSKVKSSGGEIGG
jgi:hypothetical protein